MKDGGKTRNIATRAPVGLDARTTTMQTSKTDNPPANRLERRLEQRLEEWLGLEALGREEDADRVLAAAFADLPPLEPSVGFADRVLREARPFAIRPAMAAARVSPLAEPSWTVRLAILGALLLGALSVACLPLLMGGLAALVEPFDVARMLVGGVVGTVHRFVEVLAVWRILGNLGNAIWLVVSSPPLIALWLALTAFSALSFRWLNELLSPQRSTFHAHAA